MILVASGGGEGVCLLRVSVSGSPIPGLKDSVNNVEHRHRRFVLVRDEVSSSLSSVCGMQSAFIWLSSERQRSTSSCHSFSILVKRCVNVSILAFASATRVTHQES